MKLTHIGSETTPWIEQTSTEPNVVFNAPTVALTRLLKSRKIDASHIAAAEGIIRGYDQISHECKVRTSNPERVGGHAVLHETEAEAEIGLQYSRWKGRVTDKQRWFCIVVCCDGLALGRACSWRRVSRSDGLHELRTGLDAFWGL